MRKERGTVLRRLMTGVSIGTAVGLIWACIETGKTPLDLFVSRRPPRVDVPKVEPTPLPLPTTLPPVISSAPPPAPPEPLPAPPVPPVPESPRIARMAPAEWTALRNQVDWKVVHGDFSGALQSLQVLETRHPPEESAEEAKDLVERIKSYIELVGEMDSRCVREPPRLMHFTLVSGQSRMAALVTRDDRWLYIDELTGLAEKLDRTHLREPPRELTREEALVYVEWVLERRCSNRGIICERKNGSGNIEAFFDNPRRRIPPSALDYFDVAEFCAENGLARYVAMLLEIARKREENLVRAVREAKAAGLIKLIRQYERLGLFLERGEAFARLNSRYFETDTFRREIAWLKEKFGARVKEPPRIASTLPARPKGEKGGRESSAVPQPVPPSEEGWEREYKGPVSLTEAEACMARGDGFFKEGKRHLARSDPNENPRGWAEENRKALDLMSKAWEQYDNAQIIYQRLRKPIPRELLDKHRETNMIRAMCRKRAVRSD